MKEPCSTPEAAGKAGPGRRTASPPAWILESPWILDHLRSRPGRLRVALTGGIASGKSAAAEIFRLLGAEHIDLDVLARLAAAPGGAGWEALRGIFGPKYFLADGALDRPKVSRAVFKDQSLKARLEEALHPPTWAMMGQELARHDDAAAIVVSVPLLFEAGLESFFSPIVLVFAGPETQLARLMGRNPGLGRRQARRIIAGQWPAADKIPRADYIIDNSGSIGAAISQAGQVWRRLTQECK
ncbi:MAG: dephospho-CoA kinase [Candidatus Adiutrix sp.]|jgi:dephospho-CoA kinase|nr:dephospho-CoA kinase [Candidatus Adiutrix sp.]